MPTAELENASEIDALLADADALMDRIQAGLPETQEAASEVVDAAPEVVVDETAAVVEAAPPEAADETVPVDEPVAITQAEAAAIEAAELAAEAETLSPKVDNASTAPQAWAEEAQLDGQAALDDQLPDISEQGVQSLGDGETSETSTEKARQKRRSPWKWLLCVLHKPIDALVLLDLPFAGISAEVKSYIGLAAVATLLAAAFTWVARDQLRPKRDYPQPPAIVLPDVPESAAGGEKSAGGEKPSGGH